MANVMQIAWEIAREGAKKFGGGVKEYFAEALRMAWAIVKDNMKVTKENMVQVLEKVAKELPYAIDLEPYFIGGNLVQINIARFGRNRGFASIEQGKFNVAGMFVKDAKEIKEALLHITSYVVTEKGHLDMDYDTYKSTSEEEKEFIRNSFKWNSEIKKWEVKEGGDYIVQISDSFKRNVKRNKEKAIDLFVNPAIKEEVLKQI